MLYNITINSHMRTVTSPMLHDLLKEGTSPEVESLTLFFDCDEVAMLFRCELMMRIWGKPIFVYDVHENEMYIYNPNTNVEEA